MPVAPAVCVAMGGLPNVRPILHFPGRFSTATRFAAETRGVGRITPSCSRCEPKTIAAFTAKS
jgi:hypothetical protein